MLDLVTAGILTWLHLGKPVARNLQPLNLFPWHDTSIFLLPTLEIDSLTAKNIQAYLQNLTQQGINPDRQGIWIQSGWHSLASNQGTMPLPAASLTKIATTLTALEQWGVNHRFTTNVYRTGTIVKGVLQGDLLVVGNGDPLFVWEEAIAIGNALNQLGIRSVQGNLLVTDKFYMNYQQQTKSAGELFKQGLNSQQWSREITQQYLQMPVGTPQPEIAIAGEVKVVGMIPPHAKLLVAHQSLPLVKILRQMNIYSNNHMAQMLADLLGGADEIAQKAAKIANFNEDELQLSNGSGLGEDNLISPRAVCQMLMAINRLVRADSLAVTDLFPTTGKDLVGTVQDRGLPRGITVKTGTLDNVSALAGVIPTRDRGQVYFSIINYGHQYQYFRQQQDYLLNQLVQEWQLMPNSFSLTEETTWLLGDPLRNKVIISR